MLLSFSVENFRSFHTEETLNLLASKRLGTKDEPDRCRAVPGTEEHALRVASLYGANGAGKSNLVRALGLLPGLVLEGTKRGDPISYQPFLLNENSPTEPSSFEVQFLEEGEVFRYGVCCDADRIHEEWLDVYEGKKERNVFTRATDKDGSVKVELGPAAKAESSSTKIKALAAIGARPNQLFLTEVVNLDDPEAQGVRFQRAIQWFASTLTIVKADAAFRPLVHLIDEDETFAEFAGNFLREANTGITSLEVRTENLASISSVSSDVRKKVPEVLGPGEVAVVPCANGEQIHFEGVGSGAVEVRRIAALHEATKGEPVRFLLQEESDGSRRLLHLLPALYSLVTKGGVFVIDELERSMHPMLARKFIEFFLKAGSHVNSQLIFTTHESTLLDLDLVRRDGIWFSEKDKAGATRLYSLADFKVRNDLRIDKGYLQGRFGAIPFLGGIDHLMEDQAAEEVEA